MKLPKKLKRFKELESEMTTVDLFMFNKINELRDYLSDKESLDKLTNPEFIKALKKENNIQYDLNHPTLPGKEASKGEKGDMRWFDRKVWFNELDGRARCAECDQIMFDVREHSCVEIKPEDISGNYDYKVDISKSVPMEEKCDCPRCNPPQQEEFYGETLSEEAKLDMRIRNTRLNNYIESKKQPQEESRGECENCGVNKPGGVIAATSDLKHCAVCGRDLFPEDNFPEPQLKEESPKLYAHGDYYKSLKESPKEDEMDEFTDKFCGTGRFTDFESFREVKTYIKANFVSKEKIKEIRLDERKKLLKEIYDAGKMEGGYYNPGKSYRCFDSLFRNSISDNPSLGLEEL